jgi:hypothetical protein
MHGFYSRAELEQVANQILGERLDGRPDQDIYVESAVQNFKIGSRRRVRGWTLHYCRASVALPYTNKYRLVGNLTPALGDVPSPLEGPGCEVILTVAAPAGQKNITIPDIDSPVNLYQGGTIECWTTVGTFEFHRIASSTVSNGTSVVLTLEDPLVNALAIGNMVAPLPSIYYATGPMGVTYPRRETAVCLPLIPVTVNRFYWGITYGQVFLSCQGTNWPGKLVDCKDVFVWQDGTIAALNDWGAGTYDGASTSPQRVGYGLPSGDYGSGNIMLQLDP